MDQISLTELRRFYFGPTLLESILYGYDCLQEFFGWNSSAKKDGKSVKEQNDLRDAVSASRSSVEAVSDQQIKTEPVEKFESNVNDSFDTNLIVATMSHDYNSNHAAKRSTLEDHNAKIKKDSKDSMKSLINAKLSENLKLPSKIENTSVKMSHSREKSSNEFRSSKNSSVIAEDQSKGIKSEQKLSDKSTEDKSAENKSSLLSFRSPRNDIMPVMSSRDSRKSSVQKRKTSEIVLKDSNPGRKLSLLKSLGRRSSDTSANKLKAFGQSDERASRELRTLSSLSKDLSSQNSQFKSCQSGSSLQMARADSKETPQKRPVTSPPPETKISPSSPSPQRRRSSSNPLRHPSPLESQRAASATSATAQHQQSRHRPRKVSTRWAIVRINEFDDGAKTYEILPEAAKLLPAAAAAANGRDPLDLLRRIQKQHKLQPVPPELTATEVIFATLPGGHTIAYKSDVREML